MDENCLRFQPCKRKVKRCLCQCLHNKVAAAAEFFLAWLRSRADGELTDGDKLWTLCRYYFLCYYSPGCQVSSN